MAKFDKATTTELEAAAFRRLVEHLRERSDVQNIDLMNLAGFCRNCLSNWYQEAASASGQALSKDEAREMFADLLSRRNAFGLLSEDIHPMSGELWGNLPQTYSMAGIVNTARMLSRSWQDAWAS